MALADILDLLDCDAGDVRLLKDEGRGNASWLVDPGGATPFVLRRYDAASTLPDLEYEHAVLRHLAERARVVASPISELLRDDGFWYCATRFVPGRSISSPSAAQRRRRGVDLARLHVALRGLDERLGQRPGWQPQHAGVTVHTNLDWRTRLEEFHAHDPRLATWVAGAVVDTTAELAAHGADALPLTILHGDFAEWNVHHTDDGVLAGVIDFGLTHLDSRPYELAIARTYRSPETVEGYRDELARLGWPLTDLEEACIEPVHHAFRVDMAVWEIDFGHRTGTYRTDLIERQIARSGTPPP